MAAMQKEAAGKGGVKAATALAAILKMDSVLSLDVIKNAFDVLDEQALHSGAAVAGTSGAADAHAGDPEAAEIDALVAERTAAKKAKDFARADEIRNQLTARGVIIIDTPTGPTWKRS
jgi:cysteinyl-tRNA synthetase